HTDRCDQATGPMVDCTDGERQHEEGDGGWPLSGVEGREEERSQDNAESGGAEWSRGGLTTLGLRYEGEAVIQFPIAGTRWDGTAVGRGSDFEFFRLRSRRGTPPQELDQPALENPSKEQLLEHGS